MDDTPESYRARGRQELAHTIASFADLAGNFAGDMAYSFSPEGRKTRKRRAERRKAAFVRLARRLIIAAAVILAATIAAGVVIGPIGLGGLMAAVLALVVAWAAIIAWNGKQAEAPPERFVQSDLAQLPARTEAWLEKQRPALPAPAQRQIDQITLGLEQLGPQLAGLDAREPAAVEVRRLVGEELPELLRGYARVPDPLRRQPLNGGLSPDRQLVEGLGTIGEELGRMNQQLAAGDLHALATQQRYLELKYRGDGAIDDGLSGKLS